MNYLIFNGESSEDFGVYIGGQGTYNAPARSVTKYTIPGRNGELVKDNGRFDNITIEYPVVIMEDFRERSEAFNAWLKSSVGYCRLEDTYHPEYYRMAMITDSIVYQTGTLNRYGKGKITFDCKPQKWLKSGETVIKGSTAFTVVNPTRFASFPRFTVHGNGDGTLMIGNHIVNITGIEDHIVIDSELQTAYKDTLNCNSQIDVGTAFPHFVPGPNNIEFDGGITSVDIEGRWWTV